MRARATEPSRSRIFRRVTSASPPAWARPRRVQATALPAMSKDACARRARSGVLPPFDAQEQSLLDEAAAGGGHEPGNPAAQPSHPGAARPDAGAGAPARGTGGGAGRRQAQGRGSHRDEVHVPREHEPRNPHADERDHRPLASRPQDPAVAQAARLRRQGPQRRHVAAGDHQRHPRLLQDRGRQARHRNHRLQARRRHQLGDDADRAEGAREGTRVPGARRARHPGAPARRSAPPGPDSDQLRQQRREVHRTRRNPGQHRTARTHRRRRCSSSSPCATPASA